MNDYDYYGDAFGAGLGAFFAFMMVFIGIMLLFAVGMYVYSSIAYMKMYKKSGHPNPWGAWVPFYRDFLFFEHGGVSGWTYIIAYAATMVLTGIGSAVSLAGPLTALSSSGSGYYDDSLGGAAVGSMVVGQLFNLLSYVPVVGLIVLQIFVIINLNRAFSRPGAGMIVLGILVPVVWIGVLAWGSASVWRPEGAIHGTRGLFFPRKGNTYLERQIAQRFGGQMPAHAQKQPKAQPAQYAAQPGQQYPAQQYPGQPFQGQQQPGQQPQDPAQQYPGQAVQPQAPAYPAQQPYAPQAPVYPPQAPAVPAQPYAPQAPAYQPQAPVPPAVPVTPVVPPQPYAPQDPAQQAPAQPYQAPVQPTIQPSAPQAPAPQAPVNPEAPAAPTEDDQQK